MARTRKPARKRKTKAKRKRKTKPRKKVSRVQSNWKKISTGAGALSALSLITGTDMAASTGQPVGVRAKNFVNSLMGRVSGYSPFANDASAGGSIPQTVSLDGIFNKYTGIGLSLIGYSMLPIKFAPHRAKAKTLGKGIFSGGLIGGIFKPNTNPHNTNLISQTPMLQNGGVT